MSSLTKTSKSSRRVSPPSVNGDADANTSIRHKLLPLPRREAIDSNERHVLITEEAYRRAEQRGFVPGCELEDWLLAEAEIDARLCGELHVF